MPTPGQAQQPPQPPQQAPASPDLGSFGSLPDAAPQKGATAATGTAGPDLGSFANLPAKVVTPGLPETILDQASRGLSLGFAPQLMGGIKAIENAGKYMAAGAHGAPNQSWSGLGDAMSQGYTTGRDALRAQYDQETAAHPAISRAADIGGSIGGAFLSGGSNLLGSAAERLAPKLTANMLGRAVARGTLPAIEAGAERAIGETRDDNYAGNVARSVPLSALFGTAGGVAGQLNGAAQAARAGSAAKAAQYAAANAADVADPALLQKFRDYITRPGFAKAYQKATDDAADEGNPLPALPQSPGPAPFGRVANATSGTMPTPFAQGLPIRVVDATKRAVDMMHNDGDITDKAYNAFYSDIVHPAGKAVPAFAAARSSARDVIRAQQLVGALLAPGKSPVATLAGGALGLAAGHSPGAGMAGLGAARLASTMAGTPAYSGLAPDAAATLARALSAAATARGQNP